MVPPETDAPPTAALPTGPAPEELEVSTASSLLLETSTDATGPLEPRSGRVAGGSDDALESGVRWVGTSTRSLGFSLEQPSQNDMTPSMQAENVADLIRAR